MQIFLKYCWLTISFLLPLWESVSMCEVFCFKFFYVFQLLEFFFSFSQWNSDHFPNAYLILKHIVSGDKCEILFLACTKYSIHFVSFYFIKGDWVIFSLGTIVRVFCKLLLVPQVNIKPHSLYIIVFPSQEPSPSCMPVQFLLILHVSVQASPPLGSPPWEGGSSSLAPQPTVSHANTHTSSRLLSLQIKMTDPMFIFAILFYYFNYVFMPSLGLHCCSRAFSSCSEWRLLFVGGAVASLLQSMALGAQASVFAAHGLSFSMA